MPVSVEKLVCWDEALEPLVAESRALPGIPEAEEPRFQSWVDWIVDQMRHREINAVAAFAGDTPVGLAGYRRKGYAVRVPYLYVSSLGGPRAVPGHDPLAAFLGRAEDYWRPARRIIIEGGPQTLLDEALGSEGFTAAGYLRLERVRLERSLEEPLAAPPDPDIIPLPTGDLLALVRLQHVGYAGSPDELLIDDPEAMVYELLSDPWFSADTSFAARDEQGLLGALYTFHKGPLAWIASLCVDPRGRGRGLGARLMLHALAAYRAAGFRRAGLHVTLANRPATRLYERMGFALAERRSLLYAKQLAAPPGTDAPHGPLIL